MSDVYGPCPNGCEASEPDFDEPCDYEPSDADYDDAAERAVAHLYEPRY